MARKNWAALSLKQQDSRTEVRGNGFFSVKDVERLLGIERKTLQQWVKRWNLVKTNDQDGRKKTKYEFSLDNLVTLSLLTVLDEYRIELPVLGRLINKILREELDVREIKTGDGNTKFLLDPEKFNLWTYYRIDPGHHKESGFYLLLSMPLSGREKEIGYTFGDYEEIVALMNRMRKDRKDFKNFAGIIVIDLVALICDIEEKTGLTF